MLALLSYPPLVEPNLPTRAQAQVWSVAYVASRCCAAALAWSGKRWRDSRNGRRRVRRPPPRPLEPTLLWMGLAACASTLLLAVTTFLTQDVAAIPFLWIVPLSVYLLSFIICFESPRLYWRAVYLPLLPLALAFCAWRIRGTRRSIEYRRGHRHHDRCPYSSSAWCAMANWPASSRTPAISPASI